MLKEYESFDLVNINDKEFKSKFVERLPNSRELDKDIKIHDLIEDFSIKVYGLKERDFLPKCIIGIDYIEDIGYYMLIKNNSDYSVVKFSKDPIIAFKEIVINILMYFDDNIDNMLDRWNLYYDDKVPKDIISYYENKKESIQKVIK